MPQAVKGTNPRHSALYHLLKAYMVLTTAGAVKPNPWLQQYRLLFPLCCRGVLFVATYSTCKLLVTA